MKTFFKQSKRAIKLLASLLYFRIKRNFSILFQSVFTKSIYRNENWCFSGGYISIRILRSNYYQSRHSTWQTPVIVLWTVVYELSKWLSYKKWRWKENIKIMLFYHTSCIIFLNVVITGTCIIHGKSLLTNTTVAKIMLIFFPRWPPLKISIFVQITFY